MNPPAPQTSAVFPVIDCDDMRLSSYLWLSDRNASDAVALAFRARYRPSGETHHPTSQHAERPALGRGAVFMPQARAPSGEGEWEPRFPSFRAEPVPVRPRPAARAFPGD